MPHSAVCVLDIRIRCAKSDELILSLFTGGRTRVGSRNHVLDGVHVSASPRDGALLRGGDAAFRQIASNIYFYFRFDHHHHHHHNFIRMEYVSG